MGRPVTKIGNLCADPVLRYSDKGTAWVTFRIAVTPWTAKAKRQDKDRTDFYACRAFRQLAENVAESLSKGDRVIVQGDGDRESYTKSDGSEGVDKTILCNHVGAELRFVTVSITKVERKGPNGSGDSGDIPEGTDF